MLKLRRSRDRLIFNIGIPFLGKTVFILRRGQGGGVLILVIHFKIVHRKGIDVTEINGLDER